MSSPSIQKPFPWIWVISFGLLGIAFTLGLTVIFVPDSGRTPFFWAILASIALLACCIGYFYSHLFQPLQQLLYETEGTLQGFREGGITVTYDDEIGKLAKNFNQIVLDAQIKRMELENSNLKLASHAEIIEKTYRELDKKVYDLFTLFNIGKELNSTLSVDAILKITCFTTMGQLGVTTMAIMLLDERDNNTMTMCFSKGIRMLHEGGSVPETLKVNPGFISLLSLSDHPLEMRFLAEQPDLRSETSYFDEMKIALLAPLKAKDQVIGVLIIGKRLSGEGFAPDENEFIATLTSLAALALRNARHYEQAITDDMTKLFLKRYFQLRLIDEIKRAARYDSKVALLMIDIDHFKRVNDTYGHPRGDDVLIGISKAIRANFRDVDIPARFAGDEFSVIMPEVTKADAWVAAERLRKTIESLSFEFNGNKISLTISIGIAEFPDDAQNPIQLVEKADAALYRSKQSGRNQTHLS